MSAAYTPGPLTVRVGNNGDVGIIATAQSVVASDDIGGALVAECYCEIRRAGEGARAEAIANATLFAASHEMLELLQTWTGDGALQTFEDRERFRKAARAVMAKATGAAS